MTKCCCRLPVIWSVVSVASCTFRFRCPAVSSISIIPVPRLPNVPAGPRIIGNACLHCIKTKVKKNCWRNEQQPRTFSCWWAEFTFSTWLVWFRSSCRILHFQLHKSCMQQAPEELISFPAMWHQYILIRVLFLREIKLFVATVLESNLTHGNYFTLTP